ncbi:MAG: hypothetical protein NXI21_16045 [Alphaproteobacteria bacterium]|nr:hypothetical protein [Alphaproteobacteria bacterium]
MAERLPRSRGAGAGGYLAGLILTALFFLAVAAAALGAVALALFAVLAAPLTTAAVLLVFAAAGLAAWRAKRRRARAQG